MGILKFFVVNFHRMGCALHGHGHGHGGHSHQRPMSSGEESSSGGEVGKSAGSHNHSHQENMNGWLRFRYCRIFKFCHMNEISRCKLKIISIIVHIQTFSFLQHLIFLSSSSCIYTCCERFCAVVWRLSHSTRDILQARMEHIRSNLYVLFFSFGSFYNDQHNERCHLGEYE